MRVEQIFGLLTSSKIFSVLDLRSSYYHIALDEESKPKYSLIVAWGNYEYTRIPFGLCEVPAIFYNLLTVFYLPLCSALSR